MSRYQGKLSQEVVPAMERRSQLPSRFDEQLSGIFILATNLLLGLD